MAKIIVLDLAQNYPFTKTDDEAISKLEEASKAERWQVQRGISEEFIYAAASAVAPQGLSIREARIFKGIKDALDTGDRHLEVNDTQFDMLYNMFFSRESEERLRVKPQATSMLLMWLDYLQETKRAQG